jgi:hypothetical protein
VAPRAKLHTAPGAHCLGRLGRLSWTSGWNSGGAGWLRAPLRPSGMAGQDRIGRRSARPRLVSETIRISALRSSKRGSIGSSDWIGRPDGRAHESAGALAAAARQYDRGGSGSRLACARRGQRCPPILRRHDLGRTARQEALVARVQVPDNYSLIKRVLGLYPLTAIPVALAWQRWEAKHLLPFVHPPPNSTSMAHQCPTCPILSLRLGASPSGATLDHGIPGTGPSAQGRRT